MLNLIPTGGQNVPWLQLLRFADHKKAAHEGGTVAGNARRELEEKSSTQVSTRDNYEELPEITRKAIKAKNRDEL